MNRRLLAASLAASLAATFPAFAENAAASDTARLAAQYASWAGGRHNAEALVNGLRNGSSITLATTAPDRTVSLAGFTPETPLSLDETTRALAAAKLSLARMGIAHPHAEQIQAALIGGEVALPHGAVRPLRGVVAVRGGNPQIAQR